MTRRMHPTSITSATMRILKLAKYRIIVADLNVQNFHVDPQFAEAVSD